MPNANVPELQRLIEIVTELRAKCPWDRKQTHRSLLRYLLEEAYETVEAIESGSKDALREELGDLLLQVVLHAEIARGKGNFSIEDVARGIADKMVRRHPHVFGDEVGLSDRDHQKRWTELKKKEKPDRGLLAGQPKGMPSLQLAQRYGEIAGTVGFDWQNAKQVWQKVEEELDELKTEVKRRRPDKKAMQEELGDLFFSLSQLARHLGLDAEAAARQSTVKFSDRFERVEKEYRQRDEKLTDASIAELEAAWQRAKKVKGRSKS